MNKMEEVLAQLLELAQDTPQDADDAPLADVIDHAERNAAAEAYGHAADLIKAALQAEEGRR